MRARFTLLQTLLAAPSANAQYTNARDLGTIEPLKRANLVVLEKGSLLDICNTRSVWAVDIVDKPVPIIWSLCAGRSAVTCTDGVSRTGEKAAATLPRDCSSSSGGLRGVRL